METDLSASGLPGQRMGALALAGVVTFATTCTAAQFARSDLNWVRAPLSSYLRGEYGWGVKSAYFALSVALVLLGVGYYRSLAATARSGAPVFMFAIGAIALVVTAMAESGPRSGPRGMEAFVHNLAAATAFLSVTTAMLLQSWRFRDDAQWRHRFIVAFTLASACLAALLWHAFWSEGARGLTQKAVIALIVLWLGLASEWLRRGSAPALRDDGSAGGDVR